MTVLEPQFAKQLRSWPGLRHIKTAQSACRRSGARRAVRLSNLVCARARWQPCGTAQRRALPSQVLWLAFVDHLHHFLSLHLLLLSAPHLPKGALVHVSWCTYGWLQRLVQTTCPSKGWALQGPKFDTHAMPHQPNCHVPLRSSSCALQDAATTRTRATAKCNRKRAAVKLRCPTPAHLLLGVGIWVVHAYCQAVRVFELGGVGGHVEGAQDLRGCR